MALELEIATVLAAVNAGLTSTFTPVLGAFAEEVEFDVDAAPP
jgi:hypothetical protein